MANLPKRLGMAATLGLLIGLIGSLFWKPPYPFPYENNYAMVDFVRLQQAAATYAETSLAQHTIATAWPFSAALRSADYGYVSHPLKVVETGDFHFSSINALPSGSFDALIVYTRTWMPQTGVVSLPFVRDFLSRFYEWEPPITPADCALKGLDPQVIWHKHGQQITVYVRRRLGL